MSISRKIQRFFDPNLTTPPSEFWGSFALYGTAIAIVAGVSAFNALFPKFFPFLRKIAPLLLIIYGTGYVFAFFLSASALVVGLFSFNSIHKKNLRLILMKETLLGRLDEYDEPEAVLLKAWFKEFGFCVLFICLNSLLSWLQVFLTVFVFLKNLIAWIMTPSAIRLHRWKLRNIAFQRAEDVLERFRAEGFMPESDLIWEKGLKELSEKSERLTEAYAQKVFNGDREKVEDYVGRARRITREQNDSVVIHPRFWAIPQSEYSAQSAVGTLDFDGAN